MAAQNMKQLESLIKKKVSNALMTDVAPRAKNTMKEKIDDCVYSVYSPTMYEREKENGGLTDDANILISLIGDTTLSVESHRMDGDRNVSEIVESGVGYQYDFEYNGRPRRFTEATREELRDTGSHIAALYSGLKKQGLDVKVR
ncbi:hypothetical protein GRF59_15230 [Paenibacillus sp. HJL G12]|uniref:HK97 gp10 family phage protein n=1 Tax=Paenibacillus dendrobii TaxID=2691084 RepID=A0A7X3LJ40_9BACL|nr:hypothetical protein [Paenibacillus dendrobii]MWV44974.1 hypothetical protein [Paenibacillus dendrobii]